MDLSVGDRIRVTASQNPELIVDTKGTVMSAMDGRVEVCVDGTMEDWMLSVASVEKIEPLSRRTAGTGQMETTRALYGVRYVRSGTPEELFEIQGHLRQMIKEGFTFRFMERFLMTYGYQPNIIRRAFTNLTGTNPVDVVNFNWQLTPGSIPQFNAAWGEAKKGKGYYFVMPLANQYSVMHQQDDMHRVEVERYPELMLAIEACQKLVKKLERWDPPVDPKVKRDDVYMPELYRQPQMYLHASCPRLCVALEGVRTPSVRRTIIQGALQNGSVDANQYNMLMRVYGDKEEQASAEAVIDRVNKIEDAARRKPLADKLEERTPKDVMERGFSKDAMPPFKGWAEKVEDRLTEYNANMSQFQLSFVDLDIKSIRSKGKPSGSADETDVFNSIASITALVNVVDQTTNDTKPLGIVFSVINDKLETTGNGRTVGSETQYAITDEGLAKLFQKERATAQV